MSFLAGALGPAITAATTVGGDVAGAQVKANQMQIQRIMQQRAIDHQRILEKLMAGRLGVQQEKADQPKGTVFDNDGNAYDRLPNGNLRRAVIEDGSGPPSSSASPPAQTGGPSGDITLPGASGGAGAPSPTAAAPSAPTGTALAGGSSAPAPKFGPRPKADPVTTAVAIANATKGIPTYADLHPRDQEQIISAAGPPNADGTPGQPHFFRVSKTGGPAQEIAGITPAPKAGSGAGQTRLPERLQQLGLGLQAASQVLPVHDAMKNNPPSLAAGMSAAKAMEGGMEGEVANRALNALSPDYAGYTAGMSGALLAMAHSVGGARINKEQINMFGQQMRVRSGDGPAINAQKMQSFVGFLNAARATLPPDGVAKQEAALGPAKMAILKRYGYGAPPKAEDLAALQSAMPKDMDISGMMGGGGNAPVTTQTTAQKIQAIRAPKAAAAPAGGLFDDLVPAKK